MLIKKNMQSRKIGTPVCCSGSTFAINTMFSHSVVLDNILIGVWRSRNLKKTPYNMPSNKIPPQTTASKVA